jgi:hypothetical protein
MCAVKPWETRSPFFTGVNFPKTKLDMGVATTDIGTVGRATGIVGTGPATGVAICAGMGTGVGAVGSKNR